MPLFFKSACSVWTRRRVCEFLIKIDTLPFACFPSLYFDVRVTFFRRGGTTGATISVVNEDEGTGNFESNVFVMILSSFMPEVEVMMSSNERSCAMPDAGAMPFTGSGASVPSLRRVRGRHARVD